MSNPFRTPQEPDVGAFTEHTPQAYRESGLRYQLLALHTQAEAIREIAREHSLNLDDISPERLVKRADDLVAAAKQIRVECPDCDITESLHKIKSLRTVAEHLRKDSASFVKAADSRAAFRLASLLPNLYEAADGDTTATDDPVQAASPNPAQITSDNEKIVPDARKLSLASGQRCYQAESEMHVSFALGIQSVTDLVLEMLLEAAAKATPKNI